MKLILLAFLLSGCTSIGIPPGMNDDTWRYLGFHSEDYNHGQSNDELRKQGK